MYTVDDVAAILAVPPDTVTTCITRHGLPAIWIPPTVPNLDGRRAIRIPAAPFATWRATHPDHWIATIAVK